MLFHAPLAIRTPSSPPVTPLSLAPVGSRAVGGAGCNGGGALAPPSDAREPSEPWSCGLVVPPPWGGLEAGIHPPSRRGSAASPPRGRSGATPDWAAGSSLPREPLGHVTSSQTFPRKCLCTRRFVSEPPPEHPRAPHHGPAGGRGLSRPCAPARPRHGPRLRRPQPGHHRPGHPEGKGSAPSPLLPPVPAARTSQPAPVCCLDSPALIAPSRASSYCSLARLSPLPPEEAACPSPSATLAAAAVSFVFILAVRFAVKRASEAPARVVLPRLMLAARCLRWHAVSGCHGQPFPKLVQFQPMFFPQDPGDF